jgi:hypothetical protein
MTSAAPAAIASSPTTARTLETAMGARHAPYQAHGIHTMNVPAKASDQALVRNTSQGETGGEGWGADIARHHATVAKAPLRAARRRVAAPHSTTNRCSRFRAGPGLPTFSPCGL